MVAASVLENRLCSSLNVVPTGEDTRAATNLFLGVNIVRGAVATVTNDSQIGSDAFVSVCKIALLLTAECQRPN